MRAVNAGVAGRALRPATLGCEGVCGPDRPSSGVCCRPGMRCSRALCGRAGLTVAPDDFGGSGWTGVDAGSVSVFPALGGLVGFVGQCVADAECAEGVQDALYVLFVVVAGGVDDHGSACGIAVEVAAQRGDLGSRSELSGFHGRLDEAPARIEGAEGQEPQPLPGFREFVDSGRGREVHPRGHGPLPSVAGVGRWRGCLCELLTCLGGLGVHELTICGISEIQWLCVLVWLSEKLPRTRCGVTRP